MSRTRKAPALWGMAVALLAAAGALVSGYLTWHKVTGTSLWCAGAGSCDLVNASPYSELFGIPVALLGLVTYLTLAALGLYWWRRGPAVPAWVPLAVAGITAGGWVYSAYLTWIEARVLRAYCLWCLTSFGLMTLLLAVGVGGAAAALQREAAD